MFDMYEIHMALVRAEQRLLSNPQSFWGLWENFICEFDSDLLGLLDSDEVEMELEDLHALYRQAREDLSI
jgi:hypothetical protein